MPYQPASVEAAVQATQYTIFGDVTPNQPWKPGDSVRIGVTILADVLGQQMPVSGTKVNFYLVVGNASMLIGYDYTDLDGYAEITYIIPWTIVSGGTEYTVPCNNVTWRAEAPDLNLSIDIESGWVEYPTRLTASIPKQVIVGQPFTISGKLEYESASGVWDPIAYATIIVYVDDVQVDQVTTGADGSFSTTLTIDTSGSHTIRVVFPGMGGPYRAAAQAVVQAATQATQGVISRENILKIAGVIVPLGMILASRRIR